MLPLALRSPLEVAQILKFDSVQEPFLQLELARDEAGSADVCTWTLHVCLNPGPKRFVREWKLAGKSCMPAPG